jgi:hypothetical protein
MARPRPKLFFIGVARDCAKFLPEALINVARLAGIASRSAGLIVENDSRDDTKSILKEWCADKESFQMVSLDGLSGIGVRGLRLELVRNYCIDLAKQIGAEEYDAVVIMDLDDASVYPINENTFLEAIHFLMEEPQRAGVFPNQLGFYYDLWTLRHSEWFPVDCWEEVFDAVISSEMSDEEAFEKTLRKRVISFQETDKPFLVESAFGGMGIYKSSYFFKNPNPYLGSKIRAFPLGHKLYPFIRLEVCEHVHFNRGINGIGGELFVYPRLINGTTEGFRLPSPHTFRQFLFR